MSTVERSAFGDEISPDLGTQLDVLDELGIGNVAVRSVDGTNVLDLPDGEVKAIGERIADRGFAVTSFGSPIGKVSIRTDFDTHLDAFRRAVEVADLLGTDRIRLFSYKIPEGENPPAYRDEVVRRMEAKTRVAREAGVTLLHENEPAVFGNTPARCREILTSVDSPHLRAIFDPANFIASGVRPYPDALLQLVEFVEDVHVKDAEFGDESPVRVAGEGDGGLERTFTALLRRGFEGTATLEPHLGTVGHDTGYSGVDPSKRAAKAMRTVIERAGDDGV